MPTIKTFTNCALSIYAADHSPPHFHIRGADFEILVEILTGRIMGRVGKARNVRQALDWAEENCEILLTKWTRLNP